MLSVEKNRIENIIDNIDTFIFEDTKYLNNYELSIYNQTYQHWYRVWNDLLRSSSDSILTSDNFLRQSKVCSLVYNNQVIGMIAASFFDLNIEAYKDHSYLLPFKSIDLNRIRSETNSLIMSIEYVSVEPVFRKKDLGISIGTLLLGLSMKVFDESNAVAVLGTARNQMHVDEMCFNYGFKPIGQISKYGHPCTLILNNKEQLKNHDNHLIFESVNRLWTKRNKKQQQPLFAA
ncbi:MAG: hypothetical protein ACOYOK_07545 [Pseudobdellovibrionaceae bacterium]